MLPLAQMGSISSRDMSTSNTQNEEAAEIQSLHKGVRHLCDTGLTRVPTSYIFPLQERPNFRDSRNSTNPNLKLPVIDFAQLQGSNRSQAIQSLAKACEEFGFFQLVNHGVEDDVIARMVDVGKRFFELPFNERAKYMSKEMDSPARYGTSFNQTNDKVFCWRDFLKLSCYPLQDTVPSWPSSPQDLREAVVKYSKRANFVYLTLMEAVLESLGISVESREGAGGDEFEEGSQLIVVNCYPACPEPDLTLGMPPHSDYGLLTLLLQDEVEGLQIHHQGTWLTLQPLPNSFVVNVGDHLEIFSNGRYKSVLHRVVVNSCKSRISVASLHSLAFNKTVRPSPKLIDQANPTRYKDTDFATFLRYISSHGIKTKTFLESRKLTS